MRARRWLREGALALLVLAAFVTLADWLRAPNGAALSGEPLTTLTGERVDLAALSRDRPLLVYAWASWCGVCRFTGGAVQSLHEDGVPVLGIALRSGDDPTLTRYLARQGYDFANVNDERGALSARLGIAVTPSFLIVSEGKVVGSTTGWSSGPGLRLRLWLARLTR
ncbi:TlpA-like family, suppressor for copper sensitivity D protein (ScsD) [Aeromonas diversa CDC 2478-85]|uniref:TlpA-like family, suppressor for copper sensitivity D protein (ScsD) n=1 Tax=Aeromonas diversa CDC 2478-85 TaxID=1268237 RepID=N9U5S1_9GAMM|nr:protein disulfide oxidoreductase [Aeromonas diversa]ENY73765.1 TlpA-like family, suppressor for copper sensitivity D protein (ScsD) [Aeromonas diversa CDC 2478-85]